MASNMMKFGIPVVVLVVWASVFTVDERQKAIQNRKEKRQQGYNLQLPQEQKY